MEKNVGGGTQVSDATLDVEVLLFSADARIVGQLLGRREVARGDAVALPPSASLSYRGHMTWRLPGQKPEDTETAYYFEVVLPAAIDADIAARLIWDLVTSRDRDHLIEKVVIDSRVQRWEANPRSPDGERTIANAIRSLQQDDERYGPPGVEW
jgi:hypothetical protein